MLFLLACFPERADKGGADAEDTAAVDSATTDPGPDTGCEDADGDGACAGVDCDDDEPDAYPGAPELCDGIDDDCDDAVDEDAGAIYYADADGDGYGDAASIVRSCDPVDGVADNGADCDDTDPDVNPDATEAANGVDDDCDGTTDEGTTTQALRVTVSWSSSGVTFAVSGGNARGFDLGMAETGAGSAGWYGETCIPGDEPWGYEDYGYDVCHSLAATGGTLRSVYPDIGSVDDGYTLFDEDIGNSGNITYFLADTGSSDCWVWGNDPAYYADYGCTEL